MLPRLVPEILSKCAFCDEVGIGDSRSLIAKLSKCETWHECRKADEGGLEYEI